LWLVPHAVLPAALVLSVTSTFAWASSGEPDQLGRPVAVVAGQAVPTPPAAVPTPSAAVPTPPAQVTPVTRGVSALPATRTSYQDAPQ